MIRTVARLAALARKDDRETSKSSSSGSAPYAARNRKRKDSMVSRGSAHRRRPNRRSCFEWPQNCAEPEATETDDNQNPLPSQRYRGFLEYANERVGQNAGNQLLLPARDQGHPDPAVDLDAAGIRTAAAR